MIRTDKNIYIEETEIKPNRYATLVLIAALGCIVVSWIMNEVGLFRVGDAEMRIGSSISLICVGVPLIIIRSNKKYLKVPAIKYLLIFFSIVYTATIGILLTFHTTIMMLFPVFIAMLYRSKKLGVIAVTGSVLCTILCPIIAYLLGTWDVPLFQELILIATGGNTIIENPTYTITTASIVKILLYIVFPRVLMVGSCSLLMFYVIDLGEKHVENQILLDKMSHHDNLTDLYNQNYYKEVLETNELKGQIGVIFFDVNGLKQANDSRGHEYGDLLLKKCAESIKNCLTENKDYGFRAGGDEFVVLVEGATIEYIEDKIKMWQKSLEKINEENAKEYNGLICSMAVGYEIGDSKDILEIAHIADQKMYYNKTKMKEKLVSQ